MYAFPSCRKDKSIWNRFRISDIFVDKRTDPIDAPVPKIKFDKLIAPQCRNHNKQEKQTTCNVTELQLFLVCC